MPIDIIQLSEARRFQPAGHHDVGPVRLFGGEHYDGAVTAVLSHYLPGGQADMSPVPEETIYIVVNGSLTLVDADDQAHELHALDSARLTRGTLRGVENRTNLPASMLVIRPNAQAGYADTPTAQS